MHMSKLLPLFKFNNHLKFNLYSNNTIILFESYNITVLYILNYTCLFVLHCVIFYINSFYVSTIKI